MTIPNALKPSALYRRCDPAQFSFQTTAELEAQSEIIGKARAVDAIRFGIGIHHDGYNLFVLGPNGVGKNTTTNQFLTQRSPVSHGRCTHQTVLRRYRFGKPAGPGPDYRRRQ